MFFPLLIITLFMLVLGAVFPAVYWFNVVVGLGLIAIWIASHLDKQRAIKFNEFEVRKAQEEARKIQLEFERGQRIAAEQLEGERLICEKTIKADLTDLWRNRKRLWIEGDYGIIENEPWKRHVENYVTKKLRIRNEQEVADWVGYIDEQLYDFEPPTQETKELQNLSPTEFESACADLLQNEGWKTQLTMASGDQGVDVIASKPAKRVAIQCKRYAKPVGNKAVQEVIAGKAFVGADFACVVSNAQFTRSAKELASTAGVLLLHFDELRKLDSLTRVSR